MEIKSNLMKDERLRNPAPVGNYIMIYPWNTGTRMGIRLGMFTIYYIYYISQDFANIHRIFNMGMTGNTSSGNSNGLASSSLPRREQVTKGMIIIDGNLYLPNRIWYGQFYACYNTMTIPLQLCHETLWRGLGMKTGHGCHVRFQGCTIWVPFLITVTATMEWRNDGFWTAQLLRQIPGMYDYCMLLPTDNSWDPQILWDRMVPSGDLRVCYGIVGPFIDDLPII